jgi:hypothetical protein
VIEEVLENGNELVGNIRLAAHHIQVAHRERIERRDRALKQILAKEDKETQEEYAVIQANWPTENERK